MENVIYEVENHDGVMKKMDKRTLKDSLDDDIQSIKKTYRYNKKTYTMTLFSIEHNFSSYEYIEHYRSLPDFYGKDVLSEFDISIIKKLN